MNEVSDKTIILTATAAGAVIGGAIKPGKKGVAVGSGAGAIVGGSIVIYRTIKK